MRGRLQNLPEMVGGQWSHQNFYCPECKCHGHAPHAEGCEGKKVAITAAARFPRKNASKKTWDKFYDKFVLQLDVREELKKQEDDRLQKNRRFNRILREQRLRKDRKSLDRDKENRTDNSARERKLLVNL